MIKHDCEEKNLITLSAFDEEYIVCSVCGEEITTEEYNKIFTWAVIPDINNTYYN